MKRHVLLMTLLGLSACGKDSKKNNPPPPIADNQDNSTPQDKGKQTDETATEKPAPTPTPTPPVIETDEQPKIPEGLVIFKAADHCVAKPSGAYAECQAIPRPDAEVKFDLDKISATTSQVVNSNLSFLSTIKYNYFCNGRQDDTWLLFRTFKTPIIHGVGEVTFSTSLKNEEQVKLQRDARGFSTVSKDCSIVITGRTTVLTDESMAQLKQAYDQANDEEKATIKTWLEQEVARLKESGSSAYDVLLASLSTAKDAQESASLR